jgi:hypothetical protein
VAFIVILLMVIAVVSFVSGFEAALHGTSAIHQILTGVYFLVSRWRSRRSGSS